MQIRMENTQWKRLRRGKPFCYSPFRWSVLFELVMLLKLQKMLLLTSIRVASCYGSQGKDCFLFPSCSVVLSTSFQVENLSLLNATHMRTPWRRGVRVRAIHFVFPCTQQFGFLRNLVGSWYIANFHQGFEFVTSKLRSPCEVCL